MIRFFSNDANTRGSSTGSPFREELSKVESDVNRLKQKVLCLESKRAKVQKRESEPEIQKECRSQRIGIEDELISTLDELLKSGSGLTLEEKNSYQESFDKYNRKRGARIANIANNMFKKSSV